MRKLNALLDYFKFVLRHTFGGSSMAESATAPRDVDPETVRSILANTPPGGVTVLDVRQPWEYEQFHLPGATLLPLGELEERMGALPTDKPLIVYCHSGRRSAAAASLLAGHGHPGVMNMLGGVMAWTGATAVGTPQTGLQHYRGDETPEDILALAYAMEAGLGEFYECLASTAATPELAETFSRLAGFEDKHKLMVYHLYKRLHPESAGVEDLAAKAAGGATAKVLEGGRSGEEILADAKALTGAHPALEMAMGVEAQAMDLYMRQAALAANDEARAALLDLAREERTHLRSLAVLMDKLGPAPEAGSA